VIFIAIYEKIFRKKLVAFLVREISMSII